MDEEQENVSLNQSKAWLTWEGLGCLQSRKPAAGKIRLACECGMFDEQT